MSALAEREMADYDTDFYAWTQEQAARLRALRTASPLPNDLDIDNIAEEIESLGRSDLLAVKTQLVSVFTHLLKAVSISASPASGHWRSEGIVFVRDMQQRYSRSMRSQIDLNEAWKHAQHIAAVSLEADGRRVLGHIPASCPFTIKELLQSDFYFTDLETMLIERIEQGSHR